MLIDIFSDVVCPFCYLGKRHLELALADFEHRDGVIVVWHSFQLDASAPATSEQTTTEMLTTKYGITLEQARANQQRLTESAAAVGLDYRLDGTTVANTFDAHRLIHLAAEDGRADAMVERLMSGYFTDNERIGDPDTLRRLAAEAGLDPERVSEVLSSQEYGAQVAADQSLARELGVQGVPFFVIDGTLAVSGAQPAQVLRSAIEQGWAAHTERVNLEA